MKTITEFLSTKVEKVLKHFEFNSQVTNNPIEFTSKSRVVFSNWWKLSRVSIFIEYVTEILKEQLLTDESDIDFAKHWLTLAKDAYKHIYARFPKVRNMYMNESEALTYLFNGDRPYFGYAKFTYDVIRYALQKPNLTVPRRQKLEKILRECYQDVIENEDKMNWYTK